MAMARVYVSFSVTVRLDYAVSLVLSLVCLSAELGLAVIYGPDQVSILNC